MASKDFIKEALKIRLLIEGPGRLGFLQWVGNEWTSHNLGFYFTDQGEMRDSIFEAISDVLAAEQKQLPDAARNTLRNRLTLTSSPNDAVNEMVIAAGKAVANP